MRKFRLSNLKWRKLWFLLLIFNLLSITLYAQNIELKGKVVDETGETLIGASVRITGTTEGTTTNIAGDFILSVPAKTQSITISYIGYTDFQKTITPTTRNLGTIPLSKNTKDLNEVVVVGYGTLRRQDVTGTVATVDSKSLQEVPSANVFEQLKGKVAGLDVVEGANGPSITIRGNRTIGNPGADAPLIVLDGVPYYDYIENINPNDIKTVEVLKGASATAIYGSRGSGGVILITTNRGRIGQTITSYDAYYGISTLEGELKVLDGKQYAQLKTDAVQGSILQGNGSSQAYPLTSTETQALAAGVNTDWVKLLDKPAMILDQNLRVSSGTEKTQFNVGFGYHEGTGLEPNINTQRATLNATIDHTISKVIKYGVNIQNSLRIIDNGGNGQYGNAQFFSPLAYPYNPNGTVNIAPLVGQLDASTPSPLLPGAMPGAYYDHTRGFVSNNIAYLEITPVEHLKYRYTINYNFNQSLEGQYNGVNGVSINSIAQTTAATINNYNYGLRQDHLLTYDNTFLSKHHLNIVADYNTEKYVIQNSNVSATGIPEDANLNSNLNLGTFNNDGGSYTATGLISYVGRVNYAYDNKYDFTGTWRTDGNSALAAAHQWTSYPSVGLGWVISNEPFMKKYSVLDHLKLRAGYGQTSTILSSPAYGTLGPLTSTKYQYGGASAGDASGVLVNNLINNSLTWQRTAEYNLALDFAVLNSRVTGSVEVYSQRTTGIILPNVLPATLGANTQLSNLGTSSDKGLELSLSTINLQNKAGFSWSSDFNIAFSREKIISLPNGAPSIIGSGEFVGEPLSVIYDLKKIGIWQIANSAGVNAAQTALQGGTVYLPVTGQTSPLQYPGQIRVKDVNGDGLINSSDNQIIGHFNPNYTFGFTNRFTYKDFDLNIVIQGRMGFTTIVPYVSSSNSNAQGWQFLNLGRHNQPVLPYWTPSNPGGTWPEPNDQFQSQYYSTLQYFDGSWIRAKSINLGYNIPSKLLKHLGISALRVYANVTDPFFIYAPIRNHGFSVPDAESVGGVTPNLVSTSGNIGGYDPNNPNPTFRGVGLSAGEQTRNYIFGVNVRF